MIRLLYLDMKIYITLLLIIGSSFFAFAQESKSYNISIEDIQFNSDFEKEHFSGYYANNEANWLSLFLSAYGNEALLTQADQKINAVIAQIKILSEEQKKKKDPYIKIVFDQIHQAFFVKYEYEHSFEKIFTESTFNCVSASALYAIIFDKLGINYKIKEDPTHVFLTTVFQGEEIVVETTDPSSGYFVMDVAFKKEYIDYLIKQKVIGSNEQNTNSIEELFNKYYFEENDIHLRALFAIQYLNDALYLIDKKEYYKSFEQIKKAYLIQPSEQKINYLLEMNRDLLLVEAEQKTDLEKLRIYKQFIDYGLLEVDEDKLIEEFQYLTTKYINSRAGQPSYETIYNEFKSIFGDSSLNQSIDFIYFLELARLEILKGNLDKALTSIEMVLAIKPEDEIATNFLNEIILNKCAFIKSFSEKYAFLNDKVKQYPTLSNNIYTNKALIEMAFLSMSNSYEASLPQDGIFYMNEAMNWMKKSTSGYVPSDHIGLAFGNAASYYFKKGMHSKTRETLQIGLSLDSENFELKNRLKMIN